MLTSTLQLVKRGITDLEPKRLLSAITALTVEHKYLFHNPKQYSD